MLMKLSPKSIFLVILIITKANNSTEQELRPVLELYMHDILGGTSPTARPITGLLGSIYSRHVPFAKPIGSRPPQRGVPIPNPNGAVPPGTIQLMGSDGLGVGFGTITVIDDVLTSGPELGSQTVGRAQGVYVASSGDGSSVMMTCTAVMEGGEYGDSINFWGVYRVGSATSRLAVVGGTGKYKNAAGFAVVRSLIPTGPRGMDGGEALLRIIVHLS
ncbi:Disease resistance response protein [Trema orientale]|uniref:Dirigent protein n=1 Tax=Trema orientale TaxID=63057 RepID=A0A2P5EHP2_TREOI|nr:Disease resistance response protein [Trema orientale]